MMATQTLEFKSGENKARSLIMGALAATLLVAALAPQNTRAVFIIDGGLPGAKAFTATVGPNGAGPRPGSFLSGLAGPRGPVGQRSRGIPGAGRPGERNVVPVGPQGATGAIPPVALADNSFTQPGRDAAVDAGVGAAPSGAGQPFAPFVSQSVSGSGFGGTTPGTPGTPGSPGSPGTPGTPGTTTPTPVSSVPEPSTWAMLLGGFMVIGMALRQRRRGATRLA